MPSLVVNLQRRTRLDTRQFKAFVETLCSGMPETKGREVSVAFVSDNRMKQLNGFFRGKDDTTDVLSFPHDPDDFLSEPPVVKGRSRDGRANPPDTSSDSDYLGDIVISVEQAERQAIENGLTLENEIHQLIVHGVLHLCGYDHETDKGEMNVRELELREKLGI